MLRSLSIRNFVVVEALDVEFADGLTVLTGETGAGKSILLDALGLLLGDRFELRQLRAGSDRAELSAEFDVADAPAVRAWLAEHELGSDGDELLLRRVLDAQGRSRAWINGRPATLAQLAELGERLVAISRPARAPDARRGRGAAQPRRRVRRIHHARARGGRPVAAPGGRRRKSATPRRMRPRPPPPSASSSTIAGASSTRSP